MSDRQFLKLILLVVTGILILGELDYWVIQQAADRRAVELKSACVEQKK